MASPDVPLEQSRSASTSDILSGAALYDILERGAPILGPLEDCTKTGNLSDWMSAFPDPTELVHLNIPGTHDTCTWNYTEKVQESLKRYTGPIFDWRVFRCQSSSIFRMLNDGIRFLDLRYAWNPDLETIGFYHAQALLSPTTRMEDVFFGLYHWISLHPSETILVSMNHEPGSRTENDTRLRERILSILTSNLAKKYWSQTRGTLGTLGENRGKLILIQRFDLDLPSRDEDLPGIHLDPGHWTVNGKDIKLEYTEGKFAYIQDYYKIDTLSDSDKDSCIDDKLRVIKNHWAKAVDPDLHPDQLYISFMSASFRIEMPSVTPEVYALGDEETGGVNYGLLEMLREFRGKRLGVVILDFYEVVPDLVKLIIGDPEKIASRF